MKLGLFLICLLAVVAVACQDKQEVPTQPTITEPIGCTKEYVPVCGSDGQTYSNACLAKEAGVTVTKEGKCIEAKVCPMIYAPVCGVDGQTYGNTCQADGVQIAYSGECVDADIVITFTAEKKVLIENEELVKNVPYTVLVHNQKSSVARFEMPQLKIMEDIPAESSKSFDIVAKTAGYYPVEFDTVQMATLRIRE